MIANPFLATAAVAATVIAAPARAAYISAVPTAARPNDLLSTYIAPDPLIEGRHAGGDGDAEHDNLVVHLDGRSGRSWVPEPASLGLLGLGLLGVGLARRRRRY